MTSPVAFSSSPLSSSSSSRLKRATPGIAQKTSLTFTLWAEESASPARIHGRTAPHLMQRLFRQDSDATLFYTSLLQEHAPPPTYHPPLPKPGVSPYASQPSHIPYPTPSPESIAAKHHAVHLATISRTPGFLSLAPVAGPPKAGSSAVELPRLAQLYQPHGKYAWTRGRIFEHVRAHKRFQCTSLLPTMSIGNFSTRSPAADAVNWVCLLCMVCFSRKDALCVHKLRLSQGRKAEVCQQKASCPPHHFLRLSM